MKIINTNFKNIERNPKYSNKLNNQIGYYNNLRARTCASVDFFNDATKAEQKMMYSTIMGNVVKTAKLEKAINNIIQRRYN